MALTVEHFSRTYASASGSFTAVDDLSFTVASGEIVGLIGPNGAGKTTTLRSLAGFPDRPQNNGRTGDLKRLRGEVDRLMLYALGQKKITIEDVREVAGAAALQDDWAMANAIEDGKPSEALRQLAMMLDGGAAPEQVLGQLGWLVRAKFPNAAPQSLSDALESLFRTDHDLKRSGGDPRVLLERLVVELCAGQRARVGARRW